MANAQRVRGTTGSLSTRRATLERGWRSPGTALTISAAGPPQHECSDQLRSLDTGHRTSAHLGGREYLAVFETQHQTPYFWNLHVDDVGHTLVTGATGAGKSFLVNFLVTHAQKYDPVTTIFDLGGSYQKLTTLLGGSTWRIGLSHRDFTINPFCLTHGRHLLPFVRVLLQSAAYQPDDRRS